MSDFWSLQNCVFTSLLLMVLSVALTYGFGMMHDTVIPMMFASGFDSGARTEWSSENLFWFVDKVFYLTLMMPGVLGIIILFVGVTRRQRRDDYVDTPGGSGGSGGNSFTHMEE